MKFKSDRQRKAVMASLRSGQINSSTHPIIIGRTKKIFPDKDFDGDGVKNKNDCEPFDSKKQGKLHDIAMRLLKQREQKLEVKRLKEMTKLEGLREKLNERKQVQSVKNAKLQQKQSVIDEIKTEKQKIKDLRQSNKDAKRELFKSTPLGKASVLSNKAIDDTQKFLKKKSTKKIIKKLFG